jgi:uncharacterized RmlC-like cupin family protein
LEVITFLRGPRFNPPQGTLENRQMEVAMKLLLTFVVLLPAFLSLPETGYPRSDLPSQEKVIFRNEYVAVLQVTLKPGEKLPTHDTGDRLIYSLSDYTLLYHWNDRTSTEHRKAGDIHYHPSGPHAEENGGKTTASFLIAERTAKPLPKTEVVGFDMAKASPFNTRVIFDREMAKVFEVVLPPGDAVSMHLGLHRVVYALTPFELTVTTPDGKIVRERGKKGSLSWHDAGLHAVENKTGSVIKFLVFAFKR